MTAMNSPDSKLRQAVDNWHDGMITPEEAIYLEKRLAEDAAAREYFLEMAEIEALLPVAAAEKLAAPQSVPSRSGRLLRWAAVFIAGLFAGSLIWLPGRLVTGSDRADATQTTVATVSGMRGVTWADYAHGASLTLAPNDSREIESGLIELSLASGTRVLLEGPAAFAVTGSNEIRLTHGKLVADVPKGAEGFVVDYPDGRIIDLGTEFAANVAKDGQAARLGVFRGEIECHPGVNPGDPIRLLEGHAVLLKDGEAHTIPFDRSEFIRELPSREFSWSIGIDPENRVTWEFDVSHLIYKPGDYRLIAKQFSGSRTVRLGGARLTLDDGISVAEDVHDAVLPVDRNLGQGNTYSLKIPDDLYRRGRWILSIDARIDAEGSPGDSRESSGIVIFEEGMASDAVSEDFIGTWEYLHDGKLFQRSFLEDGSSTLTINGEPYGGFDGSHWRVEQGNLILKLRDESGLWFEETHCLRNPETLIFINRPYRNAQRLGTSTE